MHVKSILTAILHLATNALLCDTTTCGRGSFPLEMMSAEARLYGTFLHHDHAVTKLKSNYWCI